MTEPNVPEEPSQDAIAASARQGGLRRRLGRIGRLIAGLFLLLFVIAVVHVLFVNYRGTAALDKALAQVRQRGLAVQWTAGPAQSAPAQADRGDAPHYRAAFELAGGWADWDRWEDLPYLGRVRPPALGRPLGADQTARLAAFCKENRLFFALIEAGRRNHERFGRFEMFDPEGSWFELLPKLRMAARFLGLRCLYEQAMGRPHEALGAAEAILDLNRAFEASPVMLVELVRVATASLAFEGLQQTLSRTTPPADDLERLRLRLLGEADAMQVGKTLAAEIAVASELAQHLERRLALAGYGAARRLEMPVVYGMEPVPSGQGTFRFTGEPPPSPWKTRLEIGAGWLWSVVCPGAYKLSSAEGIERLLRCFDEWQVPEREQAGLAGRIVQAAPKGSERARWARFVVIALASYKAQMRVAAAALAVERYRARHDRWPENLAELGGDVPTDPFDGKPLRFKPVQGGCLVYSVGRNQRDDGGRVWTGPGDRDWDIVFRLLDVRVRNKLPTSRPKAAPTTRIQSGPGTSRPGPGG